MVSGGDGSLALPLIVVSQRPNDNPGLPPYPSKGQGGGDTTQQRVLDYINSHPGVHLREICRELGLAMGDVQYHVHRLENQGSITSTRRGLYKFFYPSALFGDRQREILSFLTLETPRELLLTIVEKPNSVQDDLARATGVSQPTISWHLKRLVELGIVEKTQTGRSVAYRVTGGDATEIASFIRSFHPSVWERWSGRLADIFISYQGEEGEQPKK